MKDVFKKQDGDTIKNGICGLQNKKIKAQIQRLEVKNITKTEYKDKWSKKIPSGQETQHLIKTTYRIKEQKNKREVMIQGIYRSP